MKLVIRPCPENPALPFALWTEHNGLLVMLPGQERTVIDSSYDAVTLTVTFRVHPDVGVVVDGHED